MGRLPKGYLLEESFANESPVARLYSDPLPAHLKELEVIA